MAGTTLAGHSASTLRMIIGHFELMLSSKGKAGACACSVRAVWSRVPIGLYVAFRDLTPPIMFMNLFISLCALLTRIL